MLSMTCPNIEDLMKKQELLEKKLRQVLANDKRRNIPVFLEIDESFIIDFAHSIAYDPEKPIAIAVTGESAAGKSTFVRTIASELEKIQAEFDKNILTFVSADNYFHDISRQITKHGSFDAFIETGYNPDAPTSFQLDLMREHLGTLLTGKDITIPEYKVNGTGISIPNAIPVKASRIILSEGIAVLYDGIHDIFDIKLYVDIDENIRKERYVDRAIRKRNQNVENALKQWDQVNDSANKYLRPVRKHAQIIINGAASKEDFKIVTAEIFDAVYKSFNQSISLI